MSDEQGVRLIVDGIPGLIVTTTAAGATESVNRQLLEYFGKTLDALNSWAVSDAIHPEDRPQSIAAWRHSLETGYPYDVEHRLCDANGTYRWFHVRGLPVRDPEGRIIRWNILLTDIEVRKQAEEKLRRNETDLTEARHLARELQHERDRLRLLLDLNNRVASDLDLRQVFQAISSEIRRIFKCDFVGLARPDSTDKQMRQHMIDFPESKGLLKEGAFYPMEGSLSGTVLAVCGADPRIRHQPGLSRPVMRKAQRVRDDPMCLNHRGTSSSVATYQGTSFAWKSSGQRAFRCDRTILATRTLCSTSLSHSTCASPSL